MPKLILFICFYLFSLHFRINVQGGSKVLHLLLLYYCQAAGR